MRIITAIDKVPSSPARVDEPTRPPFRVGAVQDRWHPDPTEHQAALAEGVRAAAEQGAKIACLQELTLSPYFAISPDGPAAAGVVPEDLLAGGTFAFARRLAQETGVYVHASLYEAAHADMHKPPAEVDFSEVMPTVAATSTPSRRI